MWKTIHESFYNLPGDDMEFPFGITRWEPSSAVTMALLYCSMCPMHRTNNWRQLHSPWSILKSNTYAWRFAMWPLKRAFCLGWKEWHHLRSVPQTAPVRWAIAHKFWKSPRPGPDSHFWLQVLLQQQDLAQLALRYLLCSHNYLNTAPHLGFTPCIFCSWP